MNTSSGDFEDIRYMPAFVDKTMLLKTIMLKKYEAVDEYDSLCSKVVMRIKNTEVMEKVIEDSMGSGVALHVSRNQMIT